VKILQDIIEPHMEAMEKYFAAIRAEKEGAPEKDEAA
jgi:predicted DNA-binding protein